MDAVTLVAHGAQSKPCAEATCSASVTTIRLMVAVEAVRNDTVRARCVGRAATGIDAFGGDAMLQGIRGCEVERLRNRLHTRGLRTSRVRCGAVANVSPDAACSAVGYHVAYTILTPARTAQRLLLPSTHLAIRMSADEERWWQAERYCGSYCTAYCTGYAQRFMRIHCDVEGHGGPWQLRLTRSVEGRLASRTVITKGAWVEASSRRRPVVDQAVVAVGRQVWRQVGAPPRVQRVLYAAKHRLVRVNRAHDATCRRRIPMAAA